MTRREQFEAWLVDIHGLDGERMTVKQALVWMRAAFDAGYRRGYCEGHGHQYPDGVAQLVAAEKRLSGAPLGDADRHAIEARHGDLGAMQVSPTPERPEVTEAVETAKRLLKQREESESAPVVDAGMSKQTRIEAWAVVAWGTSGEAAMLDASESMREHLRVENVLIDDVLHAPVGDHPPGRVATEVASAGVWLWTGEIVITANDEDDDVEYHGSWSTDPDRQGWEDLVFLRVEVGHLRKHYRVQPDDIERLGVSAEQCEAWLRAQGWAINPDWRGQATESRKQWRRTTEKHGVEIVYTGSCISGSPWIDLAVREASEYTGKPEIEVLEAMAAIVVPHLQEAP